MKMNQMLVSRLGDRLLDLAANIVFGNLPGGIRLAFEDLHAAFLSQGAKRVVLLCDGD